jgi:hypothetical protein
MARPKKDTESGANGEAGPITKKTKMVEHAIDHLGRKAKRGHIQQYIKDNFGIDMTLSHISSYKSGYLRKKKARRLANREAGSTAANSGPASGEVSFKDISAVKSLMERLGPKKFNSLVELLAR